MFATLVPLLISIAILFAVTAAKKRKEQQAAAQRAEAQHETERQALHQPSSANAQVGSAYRTVQQQSAKYYAPVSPTQPVQRVVPVQNAPVRQQPLRTAPPMQAASAPSAPRAVAPSAPIYPRQHVVAPSRESGHAHQETSITGIKPDCPAPTPQKPMGAKPQPKPAYSFSFSGDEVVKGVIYAEILGKPKGLR